MSQKQRTLRVDKLAEHQFSKLVMQNVRPFIEGVGAQLTQAIDDGAIQPQLNSQGEILLNIPISKKKPAFEAEHTYHSDAATYLASLIGVVQRMGEVEVFLQRFPQPRTYEKRGITEDKWIHYHYSNYLLTIISLYDIVLILTNVIFLLKIHPKHCSRKKILNTKSVQNSDVAPVLETLNKFISNYREPRNLYVHRNKTPKIQSLELLEMLSFLQTQGISYLPVEHLDILYNTARRNLIVNLSRETDKVTDSLLSFFDALYPIYIQKSQNLMD